MVQRPVQGQDAHPSAYGTSRLTAPLPSRPASWLAWRSHILLFLTQQHSINQLVSNGGKRDPRPREPAPEAIPNPGVLAWTADGIASSPTFVPLPFNID
ncbi:hypothetical protein MMC32_004940 [Xylographa parallela]|nr:hypothetical protein [Xylographa parallela]